MLSVRSLRRGFIASLSAASLLVAASSANAAVLVSQPFVDGGASFLSNRGGGFENADSFVLGAASTVTSIVWWGTSDDNGTDPFSVRLASTLAGLATDLAGTVARSAAPVGSDGDPRDIFRFELTLTAPLMLAAGEHFLSVARDDIDWLWTEGTGGDGSSWYIDANGDWTSEPPDLSLEIIGERQQAVPEPDTLALLGLAGVGAALAGRRRKSVRA